MILKTFMHIQYHSDLLQLEDLKFFLAKVDAIDIMFLTHNVSESCIFLSIVMSFFSSTADHGGKYGLDLQ